MEKFRTKSNRQITQQLQEIQHRVEALERIVRVFTRRNVNKIEKVGSSSEVSTKSILDVPKMPVVARPNNERKWEGFSDYYRNDLLNRGENYEIIEISGIVCPHRVQMTIEMEYLDWSKFSKSPIYSQLVEYLEELQKRENLYGNAVAIG